MKKLLSVLLAVLMSVSVLSVAALPAMAINSPVAPVIDKDAKPGLEVNGTTTTTDITYAPDDNDDTTITFTYTGDGDLKGWEDNLEELGLTPGTDFTATENPDGTYTIKLITPEAIQAWNDGKVTVNAIVDFPTETTTAKPDQSKTSPKTGAATAAVATGVAAAAAGFAVLTAAKKKEED